MEIRKNLEGDILSLALVGDFDTTETESFAAEVSEAVDAGIVRVLLDLSELGFINSTALGSLLLAQKRLAQYGGGMVAARGDETVTRTFKILELDRKVPCFEALDEARQHLEKLNPESVSAGGEEVEIFLPDAEDTFGPRPRRGRLEEMHEKGLSLTLENLDELDPQATFPRQAPVKLRFRLPLYHPTHVFRVEGAVTGIEQLGPQTILIRVAFTSLSAAESEAVEQYVKDLRLLKDAN